VIDRQRVAVGLLGVRRAPERFEGAALVVGDGRIVGLELAGAVECGQGVRVLAQHHEAAGEIDVGGGFPGQELGCPFQRLARLGEAAELEAGLSEDMHGLPRVGPGLGDLRQERLRPGEVAGGGALHGIARQRLDLEFGERHERRLAEAAAKQKRRIRIGPRAPRPLIAGSVPLRGALLVDHTAHERHGVARSRHSRELT
jgi:hypothetical protein